MERRSFWPKSLAGWVGVPASASLLLMFVFGIRMFFVAGAIISGGFVVAGVCMTVEDFRKGLVRKHPLLMSFDFAWRAGPLLLAGVIAYMMVRGILFGRIDAGQTISRLISIGVYLFATVFGIAAIVFAFVMGKVQLQMTRRLARERKYTLLVCHLFILAMCVVIPPLVGFFAWLILSGR